MMQLRKKNRYFAKVIFPSTNRINYRPDTAYETNNVMMQVCIQYGHLGSGKTETIRRISEMAVEYYGKDNVNAVISKSGDINTLLEYGMDDKLVQVLALDDMTLKKIDNDSILKFFKSRHLYRAITGNTNGYILAIMNVHRFHGLQVELRTNVDIGIWRTPPTNPYDQSIVKRFVGEDGLADLKYIEEMRLDNPLWNALSVFTTRSSKGILQLPLATEDHLREVVKPKRAIYLTYDDIKEAKRRLLYG